MRNYKMILYAIETDQGLEYVAEYPTLKGVAGVGDTQIDAINDLHLNAEINIQALLEAGLPVPAEDITVKNDYSGKLSVRLSKSLHQKLAEFAESEGVSINQCIVEAISSYVSSSTFEKNFSLLDNSDYLKKYLSFRFSSYKIVDDITKFDLPYHFNTEDKDTKGVVSHAC